MKKEKTTYVVDFKNVKTWEDMHYEMKISMQFPSYYGCNLDAFWDCLTDLITEDVTIRFLNFDIAEKTDAEEANGIYSALNDFKHCYNNAYYDTIKIFIERNGVIQEIL